MTWRLAARGLFAPDLVLRMLAAHAIPGVEEVDPAAALYRRVLTLPSGPTLITLAFDESGVRIAAPAAERPTAESAVVEARVRRWFDLDADLGAVERVLGADPRLAPLLAARPGLRVLEYPERFEAAVVTVLGQQVSVAAARTFAGRLVAAYGTEGPGGFRCFPSPTRLAGADLAELRAAVGVTWSRARTLQAVAGAFCARPAGPSRPELLDLPGIGPWSADYLDVRAAGDRDGFVPADLVLRKALGSVTAREAAALAEPWRPFRAYALFHLWLSRAYLA